MSYLGKRSSGDEYENPSKRTTCPTFNLQAATDFLEKMKVPLTNNTTCNSSGGRKKRRTRTRSRGKKMVGGAKITAKHIKYGLYFILAFLVGLGAIGGRNINIINDGLRMLVTGECTFVANRLWSVIGLENPVCTAYNTFINTVIKSLYDGNRTALATLIGELLLLAATPLALDKTLTFISNGAASQVAAHYPNLVSIPSSTLEIADVPPEGRAAVEAAEELSLSDRINSELPTPRDAPNLPGEEGTSMNISGGRRRKTRKGIKSYKAFKKSRKSSKKSRKTRRR